MDELSGSDTTASEVPGDRPGRSGGQVPRRVVAGVGAFFLVALTVFALSPSGFATETPGPVFEVELTTDDAVTDDDDNGRYSFTTVEIRELTVFEVLLARFRGTSTVPVGGGASSYDANVQMTLSKQRAVSTAAAIAAGTAVPTSALVVAVEDRSPALRAGMIVGDVVVAATGSDGERREILGAEDLAPLFNGQEVILHVQRTDIGAQTEIDLAVTPVNGRIGITVSTAAKDPGIGVSITTDGVGGASAGLMFTLAVLDAITVGDLSGGLRLSGTGTIETSGKVGAIGGARQKYEAAREADQDVFFVPKGNADEIGPGEPGDVTVVVVSTVSDALAWLCSQGSVVACQYTR